MTVIVAIEGQITATESLIAKLKTKLHILEVAKKKLEANKPIGFFLCKIEPYNYGSPPYSKEAQGKGATPEEAEREAREHFGLSNAPWQSPQEGEIHIYLVLQDDIKVNIK